MHSEWPDDDPRAFWRGALLACTLGGLAGLAGAALAAWRVVR